MSKFAECIYLIKPIVNFRGKFSDLEEVIKLDKTCSRYQIEQDQRLVGVYFSVGYYSDNPKYYSSGGRITDIKDAESNDKIKIKMEYQPIIGGGMVLSHENYLSLIKSKHIVPITKSQFRLIKVLKI